MKKKREFIFPAACLCCAVWVFRLEKMTRKKVIGCVIGVAGVILVNFEAGALDANVTFSGEGLIFLSTVAYAFSVSLMKIFSKEKGAQSKCFKFFINTEAKSWRDGFASFFFESTMLFPIGAATQLQELFRNHLAVFLI